MLTFAAQQRTREQAAAFLADLQALPARLHGGHLLARAQGAAQELRTVLPSDPDLTPRRAQLRLAAHALGQAIRASAHAVAHLDHEHLLGPLDRLAWQISGPDDAGTACLVARPARLDTTQQVRAAHFALVAATGMPAELLPHSLSSRLLHLPEREQERRDLRFLTYAMEAYGMHPAGERAAALALLRRPEFQGRVLRVAAVLLDEHREGGGLDAAEAWTLAFLP